MKTFIQAINFFPLRGRVVPELQKEGIIIYRELIVEPWRVMYKIENDTIISKFAGVMDDMANTIIQKQNDILC